MKNKFETDLSYKERIDAKILKKEDVIKEKTLYQDKDGYFIIDNFVIYYYDKTGKYQTSKMYSVH